MDGTKSGTAMVRLLRNWKEADLFLRLVELGARRKYDPGLVLNFEYVAAREAACRKRHRLERERWWP
ncbi:MAG TPA: hypothetical protein VNO76_03815 [Thermoplasmata archaeon]|nr:hypothetical protein [Thermoplasmata archaeon]